MFPVKYAYEPVKLINLLNINELKLLRKQLVRDKKSRLLQLLNLLNKRKRFAQHADFRSNIYEKLYGKKYDKAKDFRLRNEFRLLKEVIEKFLAIQNCQQEIQQKPNAFHYYLLRALQEKRALDLFQQEYKTTYEEALVSMDYHLAYILNRLNFNNYTNLLHEKEKNLKIAEKLNQLELTNLSSFYLTAYRTHQVHTAFLEQIWHPFSLQDQPQQSVQIDFQPFENEYAAYLFKKAQCYLLKGAAKIELLKDCLKVALKKQKQHTVFKEEVKFCLSELAQEHHRIFDFEHASPYYKAFFELDLAPEDPYRMAVVTDYIAKLLKQNRLPEAIERINREAPIVNTVEKYCIRLKCLKVAAFAFDNNFQELFAELPQSFSEYSLSAKYFFLFFYVIHAFLIGDLLNANRELDNLLAALKRKKNGHLKLLPIGRFIKQFLQATPLLAMKERNELLTNLKAEVAPFSHTAIPEIKGYLPFVWLQSVLNKQ